MKTYFDLVNNGNIDGFPQINLFEKYTIDSHSELDLPIECILHTSCNINCRFCVNNNWKKSSQINIDYIKLLPDKVINFAVPMMEEYNINTLNLSLLGGELFQDKFDDSIFDLYKEFIERVDKKLAKALPDSQLKTMVMTNGLFRNHKRVHQFLDFHDSEFTLSYDPVGRFRNQAQEDVWFNTFDTFEDRIAAIAVVLTKPNIYAYINGDEIFNSIDKHINIDLNYYNPGYNYKEDMPSDDDLYNFYKWALDNKKYNISDIGRIIRKDLNYRTLLYNFSHFFSEEFEKRFNRQYIANSIELTPFDKSRFYCQYSDFVNNQNYLMMNISLQLQKRGCLLCEYYKNCSMVCVTPFMLFDEYQLFECPLKRIYHEQT